MSNSTFDCYFFLRGPQNYPLGLKIAGNKGFNDPRNISEAELPALSRKKVRAISILWKTTSFGWWYDSLYESNHYGSNGTNKILLYNSDGVVFQNIEIALTFFLERVGSSASDMFLGS